MSQPCPHAAPWLTNPGDAHVSFLFDFKSFTYTPENGGADWIDTEETTRKLAGLGRGTADKVKMRSDLIKMVSHQGVF